MSKERYGKIVTGQCSICGRNDDPTEMHHIISRRQIKKASLVDLHYLSPGLIRSGLTYGEIDDTDIDTLRIMIINHLPQNLIELCGGCHDLTEASDKWLNSQKRKEKRKILSEMTTRERTYFKRQRRRERKGLFQCQGIIKSGRRCEHGVKIEGDYCKTHEYQQNNQSIV